MKQLLLILGALWAFSVFAQAPASTPSQKSTAKELAKEAATLSEQAKKEQDPQKADELRKKSCDTWKEAYQAGKNPEDKLSLGLCYNTRKQYTAAEVEFRLFLALTPTTHPGRQMAEQSLAYVLRAQEVESAKSPKAVVIKEPVSVDIVGAVKLEKNPDPLEITGTVRMEKSPSRWNRKALIVGSMGGGLALIATVVAVSLIGAQDNVGISEFEGGKFPLKELR
jgi:tetratricopeptide (TPR) repeat protein